jgi:hypothetical protein
MGISARAIPFETVLPIVKNQRFREQITVLLGSESASSIPFAFDGP